MSALKFVGGLVAVAPVMAAILDKDCSSVRCRRILQSLILQGVTLSC